MVANNPTHPNPDVDYTYHDPVASYDENYCIALLCHHYYVVLEVMVIVKSSRHWFPKIRGCDSYA